MASRPPNSISGSRAASAASTEPNGQLANLGPKSAAFLQTAGIRTREELERLGSVAAYARVKKVEPRASLNLLWALEGELTGLHWREVAREHRTSLLLALETHEQESRCMPSMF
jgi:DNA transformation protein and related proteins